MNKNKNKPSGSNQDSQNDKDHKQEEEPQIRIKSKKEKEKERKERQKLLKKQQQQKAQTDSKPNDSKEESKPMAEIPSKPTSSSGKKKKKGPPVAALREMLAAKQKEEEEARKREEEIKRKEEERLRLIEEEERKKEEARQAKKEKERARKEQLRKEGKLLSKAEKERQRLAQLRLEQMKATGVVIPALEDESSTRDTKKKRVVYGDKKKKKKQSRESQESSQATSSVASGNVSVTHSDSEVEKDAEEDIADSWEDVADSWEDLAGGETTEEVNGHVEKDISQEHARDSTNEDTEIVSTDSAEKQIKMAESKARREERHKKAVNEGSKDNLRSPICVILGHVDTGKTKILDKIRQTNVQEGEAGGITQQIGATYFPTDAIMQKTEKISISSNYSRISKKTGFTQNFELKLPGLLIIDTPGHESFTNLRSRGSSLCNIAILVVDIMHGLEPQTIESINLLKQRKTPFIVALNKIDRVYDWKSTPNNPFLDSYNEQSPNVQSEFETRLEKAKIAFAEQGLNSEVFYKNTDVRKYVSLVPTSAITGEGIPDLLSLLVQLTQERMTASLMYLSELEATVLEVKVIEGLGTTIDVVLSNGILKEGDRIVICGLNGPIATNIRALLTPQPMKELRVKSAYAHHKQVKAAMGVKIAAPELEKAIAGSRLLLVKEEDDEDDLKEEVTSDLTDLFGSVDKSGKGVAVQASTLGSLEALLSFLKDSKIPVASINIGPVYRKDVMRASIMLEHAKEFAVLLAFDVKVDREAQDMADETGVKIFQADIIYHLFDQFTKYNNEVKEAKKKEMADKAIWPCTLKIVPGCVFNKRDPIILGVDVTEGSLRLSTPICVPSRGAVVLGTVAGIEKEHKSVEIAKKGQQVAVRIESSDGSKSFGRHFDEKDFLCSKITRQSIDILKEAFRSDVSKDEWLLIKKLKGYLSID